ncbi:translation initiation factor IF-2 [bacterium CG_4_10_14_0_2_um_filter_33_32]|nr:MAG: translation initiation factor IF-2 [bacterium CG2_30_33_46]PIZ86491.1 MAG: translation initiation factor IF-2 [bacterium CG_4_10_14_0_2_um_filter_33_32]
MDTSNKIEDTNENKIIEIPLIIQVKELAEKLGKPVVEVISELLKNGVMATINEDIDYETAAIISEEFGFTAKEALEDGESNRRTIADLDSDEEKTESRSPVVIVMGHVDHGKTSLLDAIRKADVVSSESGGITQHIGAYQIEKNGKKITFLDTPGHEAFSTMRARGAQVTDVGVLVVAADDGVKPQTIESINHLKSANLPFVVAVNKIDKPGADIEKVKQELSEHKVICEDWGGDVVLIPVSAKTKEGIDQLLEMILLISDMKECKANSKGRLWGTIIESHLDKGRGPTATLLVQNGTLKVGDYVVCGSIYGKIRVIENSNLKKIEEAIPGMPVRIWGLKDLSDVGELLEGVKSEKEAKAEVSERKHFESLKNLKERKNIGVKGISDKIKEGKVKELKVVLKADVKGSLEALNMSLNKLNTNEVAVNLIKEGLGEISESDVTLAGDDAIVIGFKVGISLAAQKSSEKHKTEIRLYDVIYNVIDDIKEALTALLPKEIIEKEMGKGKILKVFKSGKNDMIIGAKLINGKVNKEMEVKLEKEGNLTYGKIVGLKIVKDNVSEVSGDKEFGINISGISHLEEGDELVFIIKEEKVRNL